MATTQENRNIKLTSPLGEDKLLFRRMVFTESLGRLFEGRLEMLSESDDLNIYDLLGQAVTVEIDDADDATRYFNGYVTAFGYCGEWRGLYAYEATLRPWFWFLTRTTDCKIFQKMKVPDIVKQVFRDAGFTDFKDSLTKSYSEREYCVQYRESVFNFVSRLLEESGIYYYFEHESGKHTLVLSDDYSAHVSVNDAPYYPPAGATGRDKEYVWSWSESREVRPGDYALEDFNFEKPKSDLLAKVSVKKEHSQAEHEMYDYPGGYLETSEGNKVSGVRIEEMQAEHTLMRSDGCVRRMYSGALFSLVQYPRADLNAEYLLVSMTHRLEQDDYAPKEVAGRQLVYRNSFTAIPARTPYRPARVTPKPFVQGPQTATVVGKSGEEIWTDKYGRVKLQFHWDRRGKNDENSSCFVRVAQLWAGKSWGAIHIPRIGQEVIVDFLEGDPDRPIITGRVYNADNMPPYGLPDNQTQSGLKSRSTKSGSADNFNELRFEDKKGEEQVYFHAEKNFERIVENDDTLKVGFEKKDKGDQKIEIYNDRELKVGQGSGEGSETTKIKKDRTTTIETGNDKLTISQGNHKLTISQGNHDIKISAGKSMYEAAQSITLKVGASSIKIEPAKITIKAPQIEIKGDAMVKVQAPMTDVKGDATLILKGGVVLIN